MNLHRSKKNKDRRSRSKERKHRRSRSRSRSRSTSSDRRRYERKQAKEREAREKEQEKQRLREIALEFKQSGAFASITQGLHEQSMPLIPTFPMFNPPMPIAQPEIHHHQQHHHQFTFSAFNEQPVQRPKLEPSKAFLEAVAASQRITASKNFTEMFGCGNSNDSTSNGQINEDSSNSSKLMKLNIVFGE